MLDLIALAYEDDQATTSPIMDTSLSHLVSDQVTLLATSNDLYQEIRAVRLFRLETGASLRDAFSIVERLKTDAETL